MHSKLAASLSSSRQKYEWLYAEYHRQKEQIAAMKEAIEALDVVAARTLELLNKIREVDGSSQEW